ncbi:MAG: hypothetical protein V5B32_10775 [Candidatus Accumulibacter sp. UW26]|jgi:hypothetical protein
MASEFFATLDWGAVALMIVVAAGLVWGLRFFLRQNREDLDDLQETLKSESDDDQRSP